VGPAASHVVFHPWFSEIGRGYEVIYVDLWGRGRSEHPADVAEISFAGDVADVAALIDELNAGPVHVYGFSYGGLIGQQLACDRPGRLRSVVVANSLHSPEMWQRSHENLNREIAHHYPDVWDRIQLLRGGGRASTDPEMAALFAAASGSARFYDPRNAELLASEPGDLNHSLYVAFCGENVDFVVGGEIPCIPDFRRRLATTSVPLLILAGRHDPALLPVDQREFLVRSRSAELTFLERSGSYGHVEESWQVREHMLAFHRSRRALEHMFDFHGAV
jgi:proline iminopeptidase